MSIDITHNYGVPTGMNRRGDDMGYIWYGIYDYEEGGERRHDLFEPDGARYRAGRAGGGGQGFDTVADARNYIHTEVLSELQMMETHLVAKLDAVRASRNRLMGDAAYMERFSVERDWSPAKANGRTSY